MSRLRTLLLRAYLRMRIRAAEFDATVIQAEMQTAPKRLAATHNAIAEMRQQLQATGAEVEPATQCHWRFGPWR